VRQFKILGYCLIASALLGVIISGLILLSWNLWIAITNVTVGSLTLGSFLEHLFTTVPRFQKISTLLLKPFTFFKSAELAYIKNDIEGTLNSFKEKIDAEAPGLLPFSAKLEWVKEENPDSLYEKYHDKIIIRMRPHGDQARNLAYATYYYIKCGLIPESRLYIEDKNNRAIDYVMTRKLLWELREKRALDYFMGEFVQKEADLDEELRNYIILLQTLDNRGMFTRIYLSELKELGRKLYPNVSESARTDVQQFNDYLKKIATREPGEDIELTFRGKHIKTHFLLIAKPETYLLYESVPYLKHVKENLEAGVESFYVLARGANILIAERVVADILKEIPEVKVTPGTNRIFYEESDGRKVKSIIIKLNREASR